MYSSSWKKYADDRAIVALPKQRTFILWNCETMWSCKLSSNPSITNDCSVYVSLHNPRTVSYRSRLHWSSVERRRRRSLRWRRRRRRREEQRRRREEMKGSNTGPISAQCCPKCARRETLDPNGPESPMHPHRPSKGLDCSVTTCGCSTGSTHDWNCFSWKFEELKFGLFFVLGGGQVHFICSSLCCFPNWKNILMFS
jgi:hypothetical protein